MVAEAPYRGLKVKLKAINDTVTVAPHKLALYKQLSVNVESCSRQFHNARRVNVVVGREQRADIIQPIGTHFGAQQCDPEGDVDGVMVGVAQSIVTDKLLPLSGGLSSLETHNGH
jgi:hypothetical protein